MKPDICLELGTCLGLSAAYQGAALSLNGKGRLITIEGDPATAQLAQENIACLGLQNVEVRQGTFSERLPEVFAGLKYIDYVLIDGHHDGDAMQRYYAQIRPHLSQGAVVIFDDIDWSPGMEAGWQALQEKYPSVIMVDLGRIGMLLH